MVRTMLRSISSTENRTNLRPILDQTVPWGPPHLASMLTKFFGTHPDMSFGPTGSSEIRFPETNFSRPGRPFFSYGTKILGPALLLLTLTSSLFAFDQTHAPLNQVLEKYTEDGMVNYKSLKADPATLNQYLESIGSVSPSEFSDFSQNEKLAFYINAYNAITLKAIIDHYPIKSSIFKSVVFSKNSIRQIDGVWDKLEYRVAGQNMTLNHLEHETIRKEFNEPRVHMALVCAAMGCPRLREEAYTGTRLEDQLADDARRFLKLPFQFRIDRDDNVVYLSSIFKWFGEDFIPKYGTKEKFTAFSDPERAVLHFTLPHLNPSDQKYLETGQYKIEYTDYDWSLNEQKGK